jgi:DNA polymerase III alpha subunit
MGSTNEEPEREAGHFIHRGKHTYIWNLPEEKEVFNMLAEGKTETVFQLNTVSVTPYVEKMKPKTVEECAVVTSLVRPGPLDFVDERTGRNMAEEYIERVNGRSKGEIEILNRLLPETHGVFVFQEQITKLVKEMTGWDDEKADEVREAVGKKKLRLIQELKPQFINASVDNGIDKQTVVDIWAMIETFGRYGFNKSHAVAYAMIAYACAYLKYHYPLEWWAAVVSNAEEKEITEVLWPHVRDILSPPDINLSQEEMVIDYENQTIRSKLSILKGLGEKAANKIIDGRPYKNLQDFVEKKTVGQSLARKLIHVGVLDSLFEPKSNLMDKMQAFEDAVEVNKYKTKIVEKSENEIWWDQPLDKFIEAAKVHPKTRRCKHDIKQGKVDSKYIFMGAMQDFILKKSTLPSMPMKLHDIITDNANNVKILKAGNTYYAMNSIGKEVRMISGRAYQNIKNLPYQPASRKIVEFCFAAYVVETKEFPYKNGERKALKMLLDIDGYMEEFVIWPDRETGELDYPENLKKNCVVFMFMHRNMGRENYHTNIDSVIVEDIPIE